MNIKEFSKTLSTIEKTKSRNEIGVILSELISSLEIDEISKSTYLILGEVIPRFIDTSSEAAIAEVGILERSQTNLAEKLIMRSISEGFGRELSEVESKYKEVGDLGIVIESFNKNQSTDMNVLDVYQQLYDITQLQGVDSQQAKIDAVKALITKVDQLSSRYVARMILGSLRLGFQEKTYMEALSIAAVGNKSQRKIIERAYGVRADMGYIAYVLKKEGIEALRSIHPTVGTPIASKLVQREKGIESIFKRIPQSIIQPKYDGLRCQIHYSKDGIDGTNGRIFSRNLTNLTLMFPDLLEAVSKLGVDSIIIDSETIGYNPATGEFVPFQETIQRKRKHGIEDKTAGIPVKAFAFDILYLNGQDLLDKPLEERIGILSNLLMNSQQNMITMSESTVVTDSNELQTKFDEYVSMGLEGVIVKTTDGIYEPGTRNYEWIKLKRSSGGVLVDDIDVVVLGYYVGRGARTKFGIGALLVGIYDNNKDKFETIAKVGTGIKDEDWIMIAKALEPLKRTDMPANVLVNKSLIPDVWVEPTIVMVVTADEITKSQNHTAGSKDGVGYSLRFPRMKQFGRDKDATMSTTSEEIEKLYKFQFKK